MTSLEDKLLGEKREYYCSSSESEKEEDEDNEQEKVIEKPLTPPPIIRDPDGATNTGPKGVIKDWQRFKQLEAEQRIEKEKEKLALIQKLSMTCCPSSEDDKDRELEELLEVDSFVLEYSKRRMQEMFQKKRELPCFGKVIELNSRAAYLDAIENESKDVTVIIHIFENKASGCSSMNDSLDSLSKEHPNIKFCKISASVAGMSVQFKKNGVPALLVYKNNVLLGNYVNMTQELGTDFEASDVENFLIETGIICDSSCVPSLLNN